MGRVKDAVVPPEDPQTFSTLTMKGLSPTGYRHQRYEVRAIRPQHDVPGLYGLGLGAPPEEFVVGWTEQEDGGGLVLGVNKHPTWHSARVHDLGEDEWKRTPGRCVCCKTRSRPTL